MAQLNITLNQDEILQLLSKDRDEFFRQLLTTCLNSVLAAESQEQLGADPYERTEERTDSRNGYRERSLNTRIGTITLRVPRHRNQPFQTMIFDNYSRSEAALIATMAQMVVCGVSTRKVAQVMETLCGTSYSKSAVSDVCKTLDKEVHEFRNRPLIDNYPFVIVDATYFKARENNRIISKAFMIAEGTNEHGYREIIGFNTYPKESSENWTDFIKSLKDRGLKGVAIIVSDAHEGIIHAVSKELPDVPWQRCQFHYSRNVCDKAPKKYQAGLRAELQEMFNAKTIDEARAKRDAIINDYSNEAESAMKCLDEGFESCMVARNLPDLLYKKFRTSNSLERINRELKRRSNVIGIFPNEASIIRLMGSVLIDVNDSIQEARKAFGKETYNTLMAPKSRTTLQRIAQEQRQLLVA